MRDFMNIINEDSSESLEDVFRRASHAIADRMREPGGDSEYLQKSLGLLNTALAGGDISAMAAVGNDVVDLLGNWLLDNTEEGYEEEPEIDGARMDIHDILNP